MAQTVDTIAHNEAHCASVVIRPDTFGAVLLLGFNEFFGDKIKRCVPRDLFELAGPFRAPSPQWMQQPLRMVLPLCITCDLGANDTRGVIVIRGTMHTSNCALVDQFDLERARRRAIMGTGRIADPLCTGEPDGLIHRLPL